MVNANDYRIARLERRCRGLLLLNIGIVVLTALSLVGYRSDFTVQAQSIDDPQIITASQINVVDEDGTIRARIGGDLPDAVIDGRKRPRGQKIAGILLYDDTGQERSGYVTGSSGNVFLTLDTMSKQTALFAAGRSGGAALRLFFEEDAVDIRVDENGPSIHAVQDGQVAFHEPSVEDPENSQFCRALRDAADRVTGEQLWKACRSRTSEAACQSCLGQ